MLDVTKGNAEDVFDAYKQRRRKLWVKGITSEPITATNYFILIWMQFIIIT